VIYGDNEIFRGGRMRHEICVQFYRLGGDRDGVRIIDITKDSEPLVYTVNWRGCGVPQEVLNGILERIAVRAVYAATELYGLAESLPWPD
jgi:hypothetical protein